MANTVTPIGFNFRSLPSSFVDVPPDVNAPIWRDSYSQQAGTGIFDNAIGWGWLNAQEFGYPSAGWRGGSVGRIIGAAGTVINEPRTFRVNLEPGVYRLGLGISSNGGTIRLFVNDGTTQRLLLEPSLVDDTQFVDAAGNLGSETDWGVNNATGYAANASTVNIICVNGYLDFTIVHTGVGDFLVQLTG